MVDVVGNVAVDARTSSSHHIALGDNVVGASGTSSNGLRHSAVVDVANTESLVVDAHDLARSWA